MTELSNARRLPILAEERSPRVTVPPVEGPSYRRVWLWTAFTGGLILALVFGGYELLERTLLRDANDSTIYALHLLRGMGSAVLLGTWAFFVAVRTRRHYAQRLTHNIGVLEQAVGERTDELERSRAFTEHLFDALKDRIVVVDRAGRVVKVNRVARESVPEPCEETCGEPERCGQRCRFVMRDESERELRRDLQTGRIFELQRYPVPAGSGGDGLVLEIARDVTEAKRLEALVVHQEKMASLGVLAAGIAHDIGNPLASLSSELELLELEDDPAQLRGSLGTLREHVERIGRALREMVDFARRRGEEDAAEVDVAHAIEDALRMTRHDPRTRNVKVETDIAPDLPAAFIVEDHLVLALINLVLNGFDAMPDGGRLLLTARAAEGGIRVAVIDDGVGMSAEVIERAFEPLYSTKLGEGGTGLGLAVSQSVVRAEGGRIDIASAEGEGTEVTLWLPSGAARG